ncbi:PAS domain-containing protein [Cryptosporangium minutisporangium]|uniref:Sensor-like histidine kinase SenX3 n=1 Tax=Cryptosporangium minutisporangium TaxID=113569 RepID=A0ABP6SQS5_9ACTN
MVVEKHTVLVDPARLAAVERVRRVLPALPMPLEGIARLAARLLDAPMGLITTLDADTEYFAGSFGAPASLVEGGRASIAYSVCKYMVSADAPVHSVDMLADDDVRVRTHPLATEYGVRAFLGVPLRDSEDRPVGSLGVMDLRPRAWSEGDFGALVEVAGLLDQAPATAPISAPGGLADLDTAAALDAIAEAFLTLDADATVTGWNAAATELLGYSADEACGQPVAELLDAEYAGLPARELVTQLLSGELPAPLAGPVLLRARDGRRVHAHARLTVIHSRAGASVCVFLTDVTAQVSAAEAATVAAVAAEGEADNHRSFAEALLESLTEGVVAVDAEGRPAVYNRALRILHGLPMDISAEEAHRATLPRLHRPDGTPLGTAGLALTRALEGDTLRDVETLFREPGRPDRYALASCQPIRDRHGQLIGAVTTVQEVTERRRAEQFRECALAVAKLLLQPGSLAERGPELVRTVGHTLHWPYVSLQLLEPGPDTLREVAHWHADGYALHDLIPERFPVAASGVLATACATRAPTWVADLGDPWWITDSASRQRAQRYAELGLRGVLCAPIVDGPELLGLLVCFTDFEVDDPFLPIGLLTDIAGQVGQFLIRRRADDLAAQLSRSRADFTALVGHDMRTPLTTIAAYTQLLLDDPTPRPGTDRQLLEGIDRNAATLRALVDGLLDLCALESGQHALDTRTVDLTALVGDACAAAATAADDAGVGLHRQVDDDVCVLGDPDRLHELVDKLLTDAVGAAPPGEDVHLRLAQDAHAAQLTITRPGQPPTDAEFQPFSQANRSGTGDTSPGMNLVLARVIAERHGGTLGVDGTDGSTTLTVRLPSSRSG